MLTNPTFFSNYLKQKFFFSFLLVKLNERSSQRKYSTHANPTKKVAREKKNDGTRKSNRENKVPEECEKKKHSPSFNFYSMCVYA